ncbi:MAG: DUF2784 domain-containing protein [Planctomycetes bacterium]|nr:DUF2784 domain-containing protein [Planctomycetota bacterium]
MALAINWYGLAADAVLVVHFAFVAFIVLGLCFIWIGYFLGLASVRNFYFRVAHLLCMGFVVWQSLTNRMCPSTTWENKLRKLAGEGQYKGSFLEHWIHKIMFFELSPKTFLAIYAGVFLAIVLSLIFVFPRLPAFLRRTPKPAASGAKETPGPGTR